MNKEELNHFIDFKTTGKAVELADLGLWIESSHNWQVELGCLNYLFAQILERKSKKHVDCSTTICLLYDLKDQMYLRIHECQYEFVEYMLGRSRQLSLSLEEELVDLHNNMCEYIYAEYLRY